MVGRSDTSVGHGMSLEVCGISDIIFEYTCTCSYSYMYVFLVNYHNNHSILSQGITGLEECAGKLILSKNLI